MESFLMDIFENFGLVTCGWSAQWDIGLVDILMNSNKFRFSNYFTYKGDITKELLELSTKRRGNNLRIKDADNFFTELKENIYSLENGISQNPLNSKIATERVKRYLSTETHKIQFNDFLFQVSKSAYDEINAIEFKNPNDPKNIIEIIDLTFAKLATLNQILSISVYWAKDYHAQPIINVIRLFMRPKERNYNYVIFSDLQYLPLLIIYYTIGISSAIKNDFFLLKAIVNLKNEDRYQIKSFFDLVFSEFFLRHDYFNNIYNTRNHTPVSEELFSNLKKYFENIAVNPQEFDLAFDFFEYVNNMVYLSQNQYGYGITGRFGYKYWREWKGPLPSLIKSEINENSSLIKSGIFKDIEQLLAANEKALKFIDGLRFH